MTKDLYYTIPLYFIDRMNEHSSVISVTDVSNDSHFLYRIRRVRFPDVLVWLSDAYEFTDMDYANRPPELARGDYIVIAKPEGGGGTSTEIIQATGIGVGKLSDLMGALNRADPWNYVAPSWEEKQAKKRKFEGRNSSSRR